MTVLRIPAARAISRTISRSLCNSPDLKPGVKLSASIVAPRLSRNQLPAAPAASVGTRRSGARPSFSPSARPSQTACASRACAFFAVSEATVEWSITTLPGASTVARACTLASTSASADTQSTTTSQSEKSSTPAAARTSKSVAIRSALPALLLPTTLSRPRDCKWPASGWPIAPSPMNPVRILRPLFVHGFVKVGVAGQSGFQRIKHVPRLGITQPCRLHLVAIGVAQVVQRVTHVVEHDIGSVATTLPHQRVAAVVGQAHVGRVGVAEQVVDVAQGFLVRADEEDAQAVALAHPRAMQRQGAVERFGFDIGVDASIRVAGQVGDHATTIGLLVQAADRHDREYLVDRPDIGDGFEHREIDEVLVHQPFVEFVEHVAMALFLTCQPFAHVVGDGVEQVVQLGTLRE